MIDMTEEDFEARLKDIAENPNLNDIANLVVNLLSENTSQIQNNVLQAVLLNTVIELLVAKGLTTYEDFQTTYQKNLEDADQALKENFKEAMDKMEAEQKLNQLSESVSIGKQENATEEEIENDL